MTRILIVDDEPLILSSFRARIRRERAAGLDATFATSGEEALRVLAAEPVDVLVTDIRMPGMDGAELLRRVRDRSPHTVRVVLSGHMDRRTWFRAIPLAHLVLTKPCRWEDLREHLLRAVAVQDRFRRESVRQALGRLSTLPSVPELYQSLSQAMVDPRVGLGQVAGIIERDPAMTAKVLHLANSAWLGLPRQVGTTREALSLLGVDLVRKLVLSAEIFEAFSGSVEGSGLDVRALQAHSALTGRIAARLVGRPQAPVAATAGLLHDVGSLALAAADPAGWHKATVEARRHGVPREQAELQVFGCTHATAGALMLNLWGLPLQVVEAVAFHHAPRPGRLGAGLDVAGAVYVANHLARACEGGRVGPPSIEGLGLDADWAEDTGASAHIGEWCRLADDEIAEMQRVPAPV